MTAIGPPPHPVANATYYALRAIVFGMRVLSGVDPKTGHHDYDDPRSSRGYASEDDE